VEALGAVSVADSFLLSDSSEEDDASEEDDVSSSSGEDDDVSEGVEDGCLIEGNSTFKIELAMRAAPGFCLQSVQSARQSFGLAALSMACFNAIRSSSGTPVTSLAFLASYEAILDNPSSQRDAACCLDTYS